MTIRTMRDATGNLVFLADNTARRELKEEFAAGGYDRTENYVLNEICPNSDLEWIPPEDIGALTDAPIIGEATPDDNGRMIPHGSAWWFPDYQVRDPWQELRRTGRVIFTLAPAAEPEPKRPLDAISARVVADMAAPVQECRRNVREAVASILAAFQARRMVALTVAALAFHIAAQSSPLGDERASYSYGVGRCDVAVSERDNGAFYARLSGRRMFHGPFRELSDALEAIGDAC